jgi:hypothetical protein
VLATPTTFDAALAATVLLLFSEEQLESNKLSPFGLAIVVKPIRHYHPRLVVCGVFTDGDQEAGVQLHT